MPHVPANSGTAWKSETGRTSRALKEEFHTQTKRLEEQNQVLIDETKEIKEQLKQLLKLNTNTYYGFE